VSKKLFVQTTTFLSQIESAVSWLDWIRGATRFEEIFRDRIPWANLKLHEIPIVQTKLRHPAPEQRLILNALYVTVVAAFEEYLRQLVILLSDEYTKSRPTWNEDSEGLFKLNVRASARMLRKMDSPPDHLTIDFWDICRELGTCHPSTTAVTLNSIALAADVESLIKLENFMACAHAFGADLNFDILGKDDAICNAFKVKKSAARENSKLVREAAAEISRLRNRIAHTGVNASDITEDVLRRDIDIVKVVATVFDAHIQVAVDGFHKANRGSAAKSAAQPARSSLDSKSGHVGT